jgi:asparagine synthase (glutamine-hydrolysing)
MAGFVVAYEKPDRSEVEAAFNKIRHRGPFVAGICKTDRMILAQNYLQADDVPTNGTIELPVSSPLDANLRICYDGQIGNWNELGEMHGISHGPFKEERLLLHLYLRAGTGLFRYLNDAIFAFALCDGDELFAARDLLGIKTLYYGWKGQTLYLASELKSILEVTEDVYEFPAGYFMDRRGRLTRFSELPKAPPTELHSNVDRVVKDISSIVRRSVRNRVDFRIPTGSLLSGGIDSSVITYLADEACKEKLGGDAKLKTFALGVGESEDIKMARVMARVLNSDHCEMIVGLEEIAGVLSEVIYYLESFDPSLVRSAVSNFLISQYAKEHGVQVLLSGEGGDEIFCGYAYLKNFPPEQLFIRERECLGLLHNNAALRLDRMNQCHSVRVVAPLISGELLNYSLAIPSEYKQKPEGDQKIEKWIFRKAFESLLPEGMAWRPKEEFSQGSGSAKLLPAYVEDMITDGELAQAQDEYPIIRSKEELYYFRIFTEHFGSHRAVETVGQWICL